MDCVNEKEKWTAPDPLSAECEVAVFLYSLVKMMKPQVCVETGCWRGFTSLAIGDALHENGSGKLYTCDTDAAKAQETLERCKGLPVAVACSDGKSAIAALSNIDLAFLDSGDMPNRFEEAVTLVGRMSKLGIIVLHDSLSSSAAARAAILESLGWRHIDLVSARGVTIFQA